MEKRRIECAITLLEPWGNSEQSGKVQIFSLQTQIVYFLRQFEEEKKTLYPMED